MLGLMAVFAIGATPAQAAKIHFGTQEYLRNIQDIEAKGPKDEALYLGHKYSFHSFILPYRMTDDGYILGIRGEQSYFRLDDANIKSMQARGQLPSPLPSYAVVRAGLRHGPWRLDRARGHRRPRFRCRCFPRDAANAPCPTSKTAWHVTKPATSVAQLQSYSKAIAIDPKLAAAFHFRGNAYAALNDPKAAISEYTKAIRIEPKFADALISRGILMRETGNFDGALSDFSRVIKLNKKDTYALYFRGLSYLGKGDCRRAIADFNKVIAIGPEFAEVYQQRAIAYSKLGDTVRALADQATAADIANAQPAARRA